MISISLFAFGYAYWVSLGTEKVINLFDMVHFIVMILIRVNVIATKYAYFSKQHFKILESLSIGNELKNFDLISIANGDGGLENLYERLELIM
jgi:hypothetical protein